MSIQLGGTTIPGGMLYVGTGLPAVSGGGTEPALINPALRIVDGQPDRGGELMSFWPSFEQIKPASRAAFLEWLAGGRRDPAYGIGYVFLYFYGLERRVLYDGQTDPRVAEELPAVIREVEALLGVYGHNGSFAGYAGGFLELCRWRSEPNAQRDRQHSLFGWEAPFSLRVALARCAADQSPLPADLAFAWVFNGQDAPRRTPATRCTSELRELFRLRYAQAFGEGRKLRPGRSALRFSYRPASGSISGTVQVSVKGLTEATQRGRAELTSLAERCMEDLDPYSRWLGRRKDGQPLLPGLALLPADLLRAHDARELADLRSWLQSFPTANGPAIVPTPELFARWPDAADGKITRTEATSLAQFLEKLDLCMEPDVRFLGMVPNPEASVVLFRRRSDAPSTPSKEYTAASTMLWFTAAVAAADGVDEAERRLLTDHVGNVLGLSEAERVRLAAHLLWLLHEPRTSSQLKRLAESLPADRKADLAQLLVFVAGADGRVSKKEIALLTRIYGMLGLDEKLVYSHLHGLGSDASAVGEPVTVRPADAAPSPGFSIPKPPAPPQKEAGFQLDMSRVQARMQESAAISAVLADIFRGEEEAAPPPPAPTSDPVGGLDAAHSELVRRLRDATTCPRAEWNQLCASLGLLPEGAVDTLNEAALDACGDVLLSGEDPLDVESAILQELLA
ncbi:MAG: TerB N-terminal domain-containing protein [Myxococcota bacterium]